MFGIILTIIAFELGVTIRNKWRNPLLNPILIATILIIGFLTVTGIKYENSHRHHSHHRIFNRHGNQIRNIQSRRRLYFVLSRTCNCFARSSFVQTHPGSQKQLAPDFNGNSRGLHHKHRLRDRLRQDFQHQQDSDAFAHSEVHHHSDGVCGIRADWRYSVHHNCGDCHYGNYRRRDSTACLQIFPHRESGCTRCCHWNCKPCAWNDKGDGNWRSSGCDEQFVHWSRGRDDRIRDAGIA